MVTTSGSTLPKRNRLDSCRWQNMPWAWEAYASFLSGGKNVSIESKQTAAKTDMRIWPISKGGVQTTKTNVSGMQKRQVELRSSLWSLPRGLVVDTQVMKNKMVGGECERFILNGVDAMSFRLHPMVEPRLCAIHLFLMAVSEVLGSMSRPLSLFFGV